MNHKTAHFLAIGLCFFGGGILAFGFPHSVIGLFLVVPGIMIEIIYVRCPHYGRKLWHRLIPPAFCPRCGENIEPL